MEQEAISRSIAETFDGIDIVTADGNAFYFDEPRGDAPPDHRFPFATLVANDLYDQASNLDREGVFRLNVSVSRQTYQGLFGTQAAPSDAGEPGTSIYDFAALDTILPHPVYGTMFWICVLNPSAATFETVKPLLAEAYGRAVRTRQGRSADRS